MVFLWIITIYEIGNEDLLVQSDNTLQRAAGYEKVLLWKMFSDEALLQVKKSQNTMQ